MPARRGSRRSCRAVAAGLGDPPPPALLPLYTVSRGAVRARLAMAHLLEPQPRLSQRWAPLRQRYIDRALTALESLDGARTRT